MFDLDRFITDSSDTLARERPPAAVRELVARASEWAPDTLIECPFDIERARRAYADANARWERFER